jgi:predicted O-methyltransferase YrrM
VADRVEMIREPSQTALPRLASEDARFGLIFIDGDHQAPGVRRDIEQALKLLEPGGVLAVHDVDEWCCCPDVGHVAAEIFGEGREMVDSMMLVSP